MQLNAPGILDLATFRLAAGSMSGNAPINLGTGTLTTGSDDTNTIYSGSVCGSGGLTKIGNGVLTLSGSNRFTGGSSVIDGTMEIGAADSLPPGQALTIGNGEPVTLCSAPAAAGREVAIVPEPCTALLLAVAVIAGMIATKVTS
jgi:fibronectin-binding autotransporter adhesin